MPQGFGHRRLQAKRETSDLLLAEFADRDRRPFRASVGKSAGEITQLLHRAQGSDRAAFDRLFELIYPKLRRIAHARLIRNERDTLLNTTVLVNECYQGGAAPAAVQGRSDLSVARGDAAAASADAQAAVDLARALQGTRRPSFRTELALLALARAQDRASSPPVRALVEEAMADREKTVASGHPAFASARRIASRPA